MAKTPSNATELYKLAPSFNLWDVTTEKKRDLQELKGEVGTVIIFMCNHCPYVINIHQSLKDCIKEYSSQKINFIGISSNDVENYPDDSPEKMKKLIQEKGFEMPYLYDEDQSIAKSYNAACTPEFFLFDKDLRTLYHGRYDDSTPGNGIVPSGKDLRMALDLLLANKAPLEKHPASIGCNIKWKH